MTASAAKYIEARWREVGTQQWSDTMRRNPGDEIVVPRERGKDYEVEVRALSACGAASAWVSATDTAPGDPAGTIKLADVATTAAGAQEVAAATATAVSIISSDGWLSRGEKPAEMLRDAAIAAEVADIRAKADSFGVSRVAYDAALSAYQAYMLALDPAWNDTTQDTPIVAADYRGAWNGYYTQRTLLLNAIAAKAKALVEDVKVGGTNLLTKADGAGGAGSVPQTTVAGNSGWGYVLPGGAGTNVAQTVLRAWPMGEDLTISFLAYTNAGTDSLNVDLYPDTLPGTVFTISPTPTRFTWTINSALADMDSAALRFFADPANDITITDIKAERGNKPTEWSPSPVDVEVLRRAGYTGELDAERTTGKPIDVLIDGDLYGKPLKSRLNAGRPVIDFGEAIHTGKNLDNIEETATRKAFLGTERMKLIGVEDGATVGAKAGVNLKRSSGVVLADADVVTSEGTAADTSAVGGTAAATVRDNASAGKGASDDLTATPQFDRTNKRVTGFYGQGALATKNAADWGADVSSRPTELTDGRIAAGLDASGDVNRDVPGGRMKWGNGAVLDDLRPGEPGATTGANKVANGSFNSNTGGVPFDVRRASGMLTDNWQADGGSLSGGPRIASAAGVSGTAALVLEAAGSVAAGASPYDQARTVSAIPVTANKRYRLGIMGRQEYTAGVPAGITVLLGVGVQWLDAAGAMIGALNGITLSARESAMAGVYASRTAQLQAPAGAETAVVFAYLQMVNGTGAAIDVSGCIQQRIDDVSLIEMADLDSDVFDGSEFARIKSSELTGGVHKLGIAGSGAQLGSPRNIPNLSNAGQRANFSGLSVSYTAASGTPATATISASAFTQMQGGGSEDIAYSARTVPVTGTGGTTVRYYVYHDDPAYAGGAPTLQATTSQDVLYGALGRVYLAYVDVAFPTSGTSGGGGGGCVVESSYIAGGERAWDLVADGLLPSFDPYTGQVGHALIDYRNRVLAPCLRLTSPRGVVIPCSRDALLAAQDGPCLAGETEGRLLYTELDGVPAWEPVIAEDIGLQWVIHVSAGESWFRAGQRRGAYFAHHNNKPPPP